VAASLIVKPVPIVDGVDCGDVVVDVGMNRNTNAAVVTKATARTAMVTIMMIFFEFIFHFSRDIYLKGFE
jgi:hypothetical protein